MAEPDNGTQLEMFPNEQGTDAGAEQSRPPASLSARSSLADAVRAFDDVMILKGFSENTIKAFQADLRILGEYLPPETPVGRIGKHDLEGFLTYLARHRGRPCKPKSYARRLTTLKVFFGWLFEEGIIPSDPAAALVHRPAPTPLPRVLSPEQVAQVRETARRLAEGEKGDPRPWLLFELIIQTGMKKSECMNIHLEDMDLTNAGGPVLYIRYPQARQKYKERSLRLSQDIVPLIHMYRDKYRPAERLFECTARNLEYVLRDLALAAGLDGGLSFESLRWTAALRDFQAGMDDAALRRKLGLSKLRWRETRDKLERLAAPPL